MSTRLAGFEPDTFTDIECPDNTDGTTCDRFTLDPVCDRFLCQEHTHDEDLVECADGRSFHHADCVMGCADCVDDARDQYVSSIADSRADDRAAAALSFERSLP